MDQIARWIEEPEATTVLEHVEYVPEVSHRSREELDDLVDQFFQRLSVPERKKILRIIQEECAKDGIPAVQYNFQVAQYLVRNPRTPLEVRSLAWEYLCAVHSDLSQWCGSFSCDYLV